MSSFCEFLIQLEVYGLYNGSLPILEVIRMNPRLQKSFLKSFHGVHACVSSITQMDHAEAIALGPEP